MVIVRGKNIFSTGIKLLPKISSLFWFQQQQISFVYGLVMGCVRWSSCVIAIAIYC